MRRSMNKMTISKMKAEKKLFKIGLFCIILTFFFLGCGEVHQYNINDLVGIWEGEASNDSDAISLSLTIDAEGNVEGSGFSLIWVISQTGEVTGSGTYLFHDGSQYQMIFPQWSLQMNIKEASLSGSVNFSFILQPMKVELKKKN